MVLRGLLALVLLLCPVLVDAAPTLSEGDWQKLKAWARSYGVTAFPAAPFIGQLVVITDDSAANACDSFGGTDISLCVWDGGSWISVGGGGSLAEVDTLQSVFARGNTVTTATSANPHRIGDGTRGIETFGDPTLGSVSRPFPLGDTQWPCWTSFRCILRDQAAQADMLIINPAAASVNAMYQFQTGYKPLMSFSVPLEPRGAATSAAESLLTNVPFRWYLTVTDANTDAADFSFPVTARMAGATTMTFRLIGVSTNAAPSGNIDLDCAAYTYTPGTDTIAAHSTTGEVTVLLTPATQYRPVATTSAAHTINGGALVAGDIVFGSCEVDATATTSAQMTDFRLFGEVLVTLSVNSWSD